MPTPAIKLLVEEITNANKWREKARCRGLNPTIFHPATNYKSNHSEVNAAKDICFYCVVRIDCLEFAIKTNQRDGIWGGHTYAERMRIKRKMK